METWTSEMILASSGLLISMYIYLGEIVNKIGQGSGTSGSIAVAIA